jgi:hypothetical protein
MKRTASVLVLLLALTQAFGGAFAAEPVPTPRKIFFATGSTRGTIGGHVQRGARDLYSLSANAGQILTVTLTTPDDNAVFQIYQPGTTLGRDGAGLLEFKGKALRNSADGDDNTRWSGPLPATGTYLIAIGSTRGNARYSMDIRID